MKDIMDIITPKFQNLRKNKIYERDYLFPTNQFGVKYLLETLEPEAVDSYFNWNFLMLFYNKKNIFLPMFLKILQVIYWQKNPNLRNEFETKKAGKSFFGKWYSSTRLDLQAFYLL